MCFYSHIRYKKLFHGSPQHIVTVWCSISRAFLLEEMFNFLSVWWFSPPGRLGVAEETPQREVWQNQPQNQWCVWTGMWRCCKERKLRSSFMSSLKIWFLWSSLKKRLDFLLLQRTTRIQTEISTDNMTQKWILPNSAGKWKFKEYVISQNSVTSVFLLTENITNVNI